MNKTYEKYRETYKKSNRRYDKRHPEKRKKLKREYYNKTSEKQKAYSAKYRLKKRNVILRKIELKKWWIKKYEIDDVVSLYKIVRGHAAISLYKKRNDQACREEMWGRYLNVLRDMKEQRMKKAA